MQILDHNSVKSENYRLESSDILQLEKIIRPVPTLRYSSNANPSMVDVTETFFMGFPNTS
jgi:hypothetical protein